MILFKTLNRQWLYNPVAFHMANRFCNLNPRSAIMYSQGMRVVLYVCNYDYLGNVSRSPRAETDMLRKKFLEHMFSYETTCHSFQQGSTLAHATNHCTERNIRSNWKVNCVSKFIIFSSTKRHILHKVKYDVCMMVTMKTVAICL